MMRQMRRVTKWVFYVVAISLVGWLVFEVGMGVTGKSTASGQNPEVLTVNGHPIRYQEYDVRLRTATEAYRQRNGVNELTQED